ncbi:MAG: hypothetical protein MJ195_02105 [Mycoplasmoidaceae bacterium]|nr:hypothetical protein [Mycoplasmoidaceae bacterium]
MPNTFGDRYEKYFMADLSPVNDNYDTRNFMKNFGFDHYLYHDEMVPQLRQ